ncbi:hypothetical protein H0H92_005380 [Tricholoma furcatifolium]|nr:hypothetical protein H0H92_005380 [Tricholoma furcatifolium]
MLAEQELATVGSGAAGITSASQPYLVEIDGKHYKIHDTAGLDEPKGGNVSKLDAIRHIYRLLQFLGDDLNGHGISLLIFCIRAPRIRETTKKNWHLFHEIICGGQVPIILAITGLEQEVDMDKWWENNRGIFEGYEIRPNDVACITATRGKPLRYGVGNLFDEEYDLSRRKMCQKITAHCLEVPWKISPLALENTVVTIYEWCGFVEKEEIIESDIPQKLVDRCGMLRDEANCLIEALKTGV